MRPTQRVNGEEARRAVLAGVLERYRALFADPAAPPPEAAGPDPISQWAAAEYDEGPSLAAVVELLGPLPAEAVAALALDAVGQLGPLHAAGTVHGELNPSNVLISDGGVRLAHAGIAHIIDGATLTDLRGNPRTVAYLTPEQILGQPFGPPADVFALGGVLAFAAACLPAFGNDEPNAVLYRIVHEEAELDAVPDALRGLVKACLSKDPVQRPTLQTLADRARGVLLDAVALPVSDDAEPGTFEAAAPEAGFFAEPDPAEATAVFEPVFEPLTESEPVYAAQYESPVDPAPDPVRDPTPETQVEPVFESSFGPEATVTFPAAADPGFALTEVPLRDPFEPMPTRRQPRYEPISELTAHLSAQPTLTAEPIGPGGRPGRRRARPAGFLLLAAVVTVGVVAALLLRGATRANPPAAAAPNVPVAPTAPRPGALLTGPGCPVTAWATITQQVAPTAGLVENAGGGAPDCGGAAVAFVKSGVTRPGASSFAWTFHPGGSARCTLSVFIAQTAPSSGVATYQLLTPADTPAPPAAVTLKINQGAAKGAWVSPPQLTDVPVPGGAVELRLTDAGAYPGDTFHVTASAVKAVCTQAP